MTTKHQYTCKPKYRDELHRIIKDRIENEGLECDLNDIDTSKITTMMSLFNANIYKIFENFNGDISMWDVSKVKDTGGMFYHCEKFNCDLSSWDVSNVVNMVSMFNNCEKFNQNLDSWDVSNVKYMHYAFHNCPTHPTWYDKKKMRI